MKRISPRFIIENCKEAIEYYAELFNGEIKNTQLADEIEMFKGHEGKYIHAELHLDHGYVIYFNDVFGSHQTIGNNIIMGMEFENEEEIKRVFDSLSKDGKITMDLQVTFWNALYGKVTDKYGINWEFNHQR